MKKNYKALVIETKTIEFNLTATNKKDALRQVTELVNNSIILEHKDVKKITKKEIKIKKQKNKKSMIQK